MSLSSVTQSDLKIAIFSFLPLSALGTVARTCRSWRTETDAVFALHFKGWCFKITQVVAQRFHDKQVAFPVEQLAFEGKPLSKIECLAFPAKLIEILIKHPHIREINLSGVWGQPSLPPEFARLCKFVHARDRPLLRHNTCSDLTNEECLLMTASSDAADQSLRAFLDPYFFPFNVGEVEKANMTWLLARAGEIQDRGFRQNYLMEGAAYYLQQGRDTEALDALRRTEKPVDDKLNQLIMQKPELLPAIQRFTGTLSEGELRNRCQKVCDSRRRCGTESILFPRKRHKGPEEVKPA